MILSNLNKHMRGTLLVTTMLVAPFAVQADSMKPSVSVNGYYTQAFNLVDIDDRGTAVAEEEVLDQNAEIIFKAKAMASADTEIGVVVELEASNADGSQIDENYIYAKGSWGKFIAGAESGAGHLIQVTAPIFVPGLKMYDNSVTGNSIETLYNGILGSDVLGDAHTRTTLELISREANKVTYITPKLGGLQLGFSFAPNNERKTAERRNAGVFDTTTTNDVQEDIIELAARYKGQAGDLKYQVSYSQVEGETIGAGGDDVESESVGVKIAYGNWVLGGNQSEYTNLADLVDGNDTAAYADSEEVESTNYGLKYKSGRNYWGIGWTESEETKTGVTGNAAEYEEFMIGGGYKIASGVMVGYYYQDTEVTTQNDEAEASIVGMTLGLKF